MVLREVGKWCGERSVGDVDGSWSVVWREVGLCC